MSDEVIVIISPASDSHGLPNNPFPIQYAQEIQDGGGGSAASTQFSSDASGPWTTSRPPGGGGAVECPVAPWTAQDTEGELPGVVVHVSAWIRMGVWTSQGLEGEPLFVSHPIFRNVATATPCPGE